MSTLSDKAATILDHAARGDCSVFVRGEWGAVNTMRTAVYKEAKRRKTIGLGEGVACQLWIGEPSEGKPVGYHAARRDIVGVHFTLEVLSPTRSSERTLAGLSISVGGTSEQPLANHASRTEAAALDTALADIFKT